MGATSTTLRKEYTALIRLGAPVLVTQLGVIIVNFADTMMVGSYGTDHLAAAAFVNSLFLVAMVMQIGFANGVTPLAGALFGRGKHQETGAMMRAGLQMNAGVSVVFTLIMAILYFFLDRFGQPSELLPIIRPYYIIVLATLLPQAVFNCLQQVSNGITDTATPMWIILGANVMNIIGNYALISGHWGAPELGLTGAGISTFAARLTATVVLVCVFRFSRSRRSYWRGMAIRSGRPERRRRVWSTSYPVMIQSGVECMLWSFGAVVSGWFGKVQLASYQVVNTIGQLGFMIFLSVGVALSIRVANYTGIGRIGSVRVATRAAVHLNLLLATLASLLFISGGEWLIGIFNDEAAVIASAVALVPPLVLYQYCDALQLTYANALRGTSHVKPLLAAALVAYIAVGVPVLLFLAVTLDMGNLGVYYSFSAALVVAALLLWMSFRMVLRRASM